MKALRFKKIDAFTKGFSSGNPAGYVFLDKNEHLSENAMQKMAKELKGYVNEVGYVQRVGDEFYLKFYSSECEVDFCGHATIAIMYDLLVNDKNLRSQEEVFIRVNAGKLPVFNRIADEDAVYIMAPPPEILECRPGRSEIAKILQAEITDIDDSRPVKLINGGLRTLLVPIKTLSACLNLLPDPESLRLFCLDNDIDIVHVSTRETVHPDCEYRTRVFASKFGYLEDPATGSGNAAFGYCLMDQGLWNGKMTIEQGPSTSNPNFVKLDRSSVNGKDRMIFGGCGTIRIRGQYCLHDAE
ncbi:MAG: PhzF family phenazine biosynthesis protein [Desulfobacteraceae bacterium]|nr:MAG: PhzF family phenazine biosynthesis protein [Desulfobacteraceae bacterium]